MTLSLLRSCFGASCFAYSFGTAFAQTEPILVPVVVTAARVAQLQTDALPHTTVISAEEMQNAQDLPSLLEREAGMQITRLGGPGQQASLFMRGANTSETLIMIDGVPIRRQASFGLPALENILPAQIDHIEIVRGNVSAIYGSGAIGGVVQIFTKRGDQAPQLTMGVETGSRGTYQGDVSYSGQSGGTRYALSFTRFKTDGFSAQNKLQNPNINPDANGYGNTSVSGSVSQNWGGENEAGMRFYTNDAKYTYDDAYGTPTDRNNGHSRSQSIALFSKNSLSTNWMSTLTLSQNINRDNFEQWKVLGEEKATNKSTQNLLQWEHELHLSPAWIATAGLNLGREMAAVEYSNASHNYARAISSLYTGLLGKTGPHQWQLQARHDEVGGSGSDNTGYFGYGYALTDKVKLIANTSTAFNAPTPVQLYQPIYGNSNLKAERAKSHELGIQYASGSSLLRATLFNTRTREQFGYDLLTNQAINIKRAKNQGLELSASMQLFAIDWRIGLTLQDPKDEIKNTLLERRAKILGSLGAAKNFGAWHIAGDVQYTDRRLDLPFNPELAPYWLANARVRYRLGQGVSLYARLENLFNHNYQTAYGYNQPGRGVFVGMNWQYAALN